MSDDEDTVVSRTLSDAELRELRLHELAAEYAATLRAGDEIHESIDADTIAPFRHLLPAALAERGLTMTLVVPDDAPMHWRADRAAFPDPMSVN